MKQIDFENQTDIEIEITNLEKILSTLSPKIVELIIVDNDTIASINSQHREKNQPTDVLSFPLEDVGEMGMLGSIVISIDKAIEKSNELNHSLEDEVTLLFIHALLHLLGYDHEVDSGQMREAEKELIERFNLPSSLIIRTVKE
jgi:probable rRNA maturation factor